MKYLGSKGRLSKELAPIIQSYITPQTRGYIEPFVGGNMIDKIYQSNKVGYDIHYYLIEVLKAFSEGWDPPKQLSEEFYKELQKNKENFDPKLVGYAGFQLSYGGKWFGGHRRDKIGKRDYADEAYRNSKAQIPLLKGVKFERKDFRDIDTSNLENYVIYCDPPYKDTTKYADKNFPCTEYYEWVKDLSKRNTVLVSEYWMPDEFTCIWSKEHKVYLDNVSSNKNLRVEKLFRYI